MTESIENSLNDMETLPEAFTINTGEKEINLEGNQTERIDIDENARSILNEISNQQKLNNMSSVIIANGEEATDLVFIPEHNQQIAFCGIDDLMLQDSILDFDLKTLLTVSPFGTKILQHYTLNNILTEYLRNKLVDTIVRHLYSYIMKHCLTHLQYNTITSKIIALFPNETISTYYFVGKRQGNRGAVQARGKLVDKVKNIRYQSPDKTVFRKRKLKYQENEPLSKKVATDEEQTQASTWLKYNREPWEDAMKYWKMTFNLRKQSGAKTVSEFTSEWPIIMDPRAESLIEYDFSCLYPDKPLLLLMNWNKFYDTVLTIRKNQLSENKDAVTLKTLEQLEKEELSEDSRVALQFMTLSRLVPPKGRIIQDKKQWKFSSIESTEALINYCQAPGEINAKISELKDKANTKKILKEVQPYIIVVGPALTSIVSTYIIIDRIHFKCESTLKGIDLLFKLFFALGIKYPVQAQHIWYLIQKAIFKIDDENDKIIPYIQDILRCFD